MTLKVLFVAAAVLCLSRAAPQSYEGLGVLQPETPRDLGAYENVVAATIDVLPDIVELFRKLSRNRDRANDPEDAQQMLLDFMPITRKVMEATEKAGGAGISQDTYHRLNAAEKVMPHMVTFMDRLREMDLGLPTPTTQPEYGRVL
ncbi:uncharacterized protein [Penaeus vannamei]|uniref:uncharacterized protein n=1 Tax=Penaeus vannamei TaxID=6689 RepID=UPI000F687758|nr:uncharacterized protein LOC113819639 [Penaeus vannamei]